MFRLRRSCGTEGGTEPSPRPWQAWQPRFLVPRRCGERANRKQRIRLDGSVSVEHTIQRGTWQLPSLTAAAAPPAAARRVRSTAVKRYTVLLIAFCASINCFTRLLRDSSAREGSSPSPPPPPLPRSSTAVAREESKVSSGAENSREPIPSKTEPRCGWILGGSLPLDRMSRRAAFETK